MSLVDTWKLKAIQSIIGVEPDGVWGSQSQAALDALIESASEPAFGTTVEHKTYASSFADPADIEAFNECKADGHSDDYCFGFGDNGIGCWGDSTVEGTGPSCALPPEYMEAKWGSVSNAKNRKVGVIRLEEPHDLVECVLKDRMPHLENLHNEAHIDLNFDACKALSFNPPCMEPVVWWWT